VSHRVGFLQWVLPDHGIIPYHLAPLDGALQMQYFAKLLSIQHIDGRVDSYILIPLGHCMRLQGWTSLNRFSRGVGCSEGTGIRFPDLMMLFRLIYRECMMRV